MVYMTLDLRKPLNNLKFEIQILFYINTHHRLYEIQQKVTLEF